VKRTAHHSAQGLPSSILEFVQTLRDTNESWNPAPGVQQAARMAAALPATVDAADRASRQRWQIARAARPAQTSPLWLAHGPLAINNANFAGD